MLYIQKIYIPFVIWFENISSTGEIGETLFDKYFFEFCTHCSSGHAWFLNDAKVMNIFYSAIFYEFFFIFSIKALSS